MKKFLIALTFSLLSITLAGQDVIFFENGDSVEVIVKKVAISTIEYVRFDNQSGPLYEVLKSEVEMIEYKNGSIDYFNDKLYPIKEGSPNESVFTDERDGISYHTIKIGKQTWMKENLNYDDGNIPCAITKQGTCHPCGRYYSFEEAIVACPEGWHLPTDLEWIELEMEVGMSEKEANKLDLRGTHPGQAPTLRVKGLSGLELSLCGYSYRMNLSKKRPIYDVSGMHEHGYFWSSTESQYYRHEAMVRHFKNRASIERISTVKKSRFPIRCLKDRN